IKGPLGPGGSAGTMGSFKPATFDRACGSRSMLSEFRLASVKGPIASAGQGSETSPNDASTEHAMATQRQLDPKARNAALVAGVMVLLIPLFMIGKVALSSMDRGPRDQAFRAGPHELVQMPDGTTMLVKHGSARRIADWLHLNRRG